MAPEAGHPGAAGNSLQHLALVSVLLAPILPEIVLKRSVLVAWWPDVARTRANMLNLRTAYSSARCCSLAASSKRLQKNSHALLTFFLYVNVID